MLQHTGHQKKPYLSNSGWYIFDIVESEYDNQIALSHINGEGKGIKLLNCFSNKNNLLVSN